MTASLPTPLGPLMTRTTGGGGGRGGVVSSRPRVDSNSVTEIGAAAVVVQVKRCILDHVSFLTVDWNVCRVEKGAMWVARCVQQ